jgi:hypothetical protein
MLTTGIVPALFADEEREGIIGTVRKIFQFIVKSLMYLDSRGSNEKWFESS